MNKTSSLEWMVIAYHNLRSAQILYGADHYTDSIGSDLQQTIEKTLKSILAFRNLKIPKTHDLYEIYTLIDDFLLEEDEITILYIATEYYKEDRYPNPNYCLPEKAEIEEVLHFTENLFDKVCNSLNIELSEIK